MTAFVRRFRETPNLETLTEIEQIVLVDRTPRTPVVGLGAGALMLVGEFEDGPFETPTEVFGSSDESSRFGGFGYTYGDLIHQNPCARQRLTEYWNGNAFIKASGLKPPRKIIVRVDTRVGDIVLAPLAARRSNVGPFALAVADQLSISFNGGGAVLSTAIAAAPATAEGAGGTFPTLFAGGESITVGIDGGEDILISFTAADQSVAQVAARINEALGYTAAADDGGGQLDISGVIEGTDGEVSLADVSGGVLATLGHVAGDTAGTGNVANLAEVTAAEIVALWPGGGGGTLTVDDGKLVAATEVFPSGTVNVTLNTMATALGFETGASDASNVGDAVTLPAGSRVSDGTTTWVTMQTVEFPAGTSENPNVSTSVPIRPATDDGTAAGAAIGTALLTDVPTEGRTLSGVNVAAVGAALTETEVDQAYEDAFAATTSINGVAREVTVSLSARRSDAVIRAGRLNAIQASDNGCRGRVFHTRERFGQPIAVAIANVAKERSDRVNYSWPNWTRRIPEIARVGTAGGAGFTADGVISLGADGPLAYINSVLNPEENPGQDTGLLEDLVADVESVGANLGLEEYKALKAAGICAPRFDQNGTPVYQSEVSTDLTPGRTTQKRRKMADFIQDSLAILMLPYSKKLATDSREAGIDAVGEDFLGGLLAEDSEDQQRIGAYAIINITSGNPNYAPNGITARRVAVRMLNSLDTIILDTEIGEGVVVSTEAAA